MNVNTSLTLEQDDEAIALDGIRALLRLMGDDPDRDGIVETPERVVKAYLEMACRPGDPAEILSKRFAVDHVDAMVAVGPVPFNSICEHHLLPFTGVAWIAYLPNPDTREVVGLSKLPRLLQHFAQRPQIQERLTNQITDALDEHLSPLGAACLIRATHTCMSLRGVRSVGASMVTSSTTGLFREDARTRQEFMALAGGAA